MRSKIGALPLLLVGFLLASCASPRGLDETRQIFASIKSAYELLNIQKVTAGDLICTTDCRVHPMHPDRVTIKFEGSLSANTYLRCARSI